MNFEQILTSFVDGCIDIAWKLLAALLVLAIGSFIIRFFMKHFLIEHKHSKMDATVRRYIRTFVKAGLNILMVTIIVGILGVPLASVVTVLGAAGAAIALALQGSLSNLASGIMLLIFHPFKLGQYIETDSTGGTVEDIGLFYTTVITPDNRRIVIPNSTLTSATITNYSVQPTRRVDIVFDVAYGTEIERVKSVVLDLARSHEHVLKDPALFLRMTEMSDSSIKFTLRVFCNSSDFWETKFDLTEGIYEELNRCGITIPFPQMDVHIVP